MTYSLIYKTDRFGEATKWDEFRTEKDAISEARRLETEKDWYVKVMWFDGCTFIEDSYVSKLW